MVKTEKVVINLFVSFAACAWFVKTLATAAFAIIAFSELARADEKGISVWLPGQFGSLAAVPQQADWSMAEVYYHAALNASGATAAASEVSVGRLNSDECISVTD